ncbi:recombinase family protein [Paeniglutamicibacter sulfureus]|uniref:DNA invertase Pin-like site-specific DNA recombinase n=1 Tax=Paeniglutamicibacter sulfureus TaxID=43666 RepID=A0ABU2BN42_9MICC|nr:recombinase family protein [Paeniglutamicibacter sulfureus]MDR7360076.1 DNA invertase Pin-like site-specific DNA recombinase [Paeniglutamicibacter sulfureus]
MSATPNYRAALYMRVSRDFTGEGLAVERQREDCLRIAESRGWRVVGEYVDNSISAYNVSRKRPEYERLVADFNAGAFDALICYDLDRLTRQPRQLEDWIDAAEGQGLALVTANGEADLLTDAGRMFARIKAAVARQEMDRKSARQARAARQRSEKGRPPLGVRLMGYTSRGELVEDEAAVVRRIFEQFAHGDSLRGITAALAADNVPTRHGNPWHPRTVRGILTNPRYAGHAIYRGERTGQRGSWEPLVSEDAFEAIQARLSDPRRRLQQGTDRQHLGSGLFLCSKCGGFMQSFSQARYRCRVCGFSRTMPAIDEVVVELVRRVLARADFGDRLVKNDPEGERLAAEILEVRARLATFEADYDNGLIDGQRFKTAADKARAELDQLNGRLARRSSSVSLSHILRAEDPVAAYDAAPLMVRRGVIAALMTVTVCPGVRGRKGFDPDSLKIEWKDGAV